MMGETKLFESIKRVTYQNDSLFRNTTTQACLKTPFTNQLQVF